MREDVTSDRVERRDFLCPGNNEAEDIDGGEERRGGRAIRERRWGGGKKRKGIN